MACVDHVATPAGFARYGALFRVPQARRLILSGLLARLPMGMVPLSLLLVIRETGAGFAVAGSVSGAYFVAAAVGAPIAGRLVDRRGSTRILLLRAAVVPSLLLGVGALALADAPVLAIAACAALAGALLPPVGSSLRSLWPRLLAGKELLTSAYAIEASLQEIVFVVGPALVALLAAVASPVVSLAVAAAACAVGTAVFALTPAMRAWKPEEERHARGIFGALESPGVRTIVLFATCSGLAFGGTEVGMPAFAEAHGAVELGGIPLAFFAGGSLVGGLVAGTRTVGHPLRLLRLSAVLLVVGLALPLLAGSLTALSLLAFVAGLPIAPAFTATFGLVDHVAKRGTAAESFAWIGTAVSTGIAAGTVAGGALIDHSGPRAAFAFGVGGALLAATLAVLGRGLEERLEN